MIFPSASLISTAISFPSSPISTVPFSSTISPGTNVVVSTSNVIGDWENTGISITGVKRIKKNIIFISILQLILKH